MRIRSVIFASILLHLPYQAFATVPASELNLIRQPEAQALLNNANLGLLGQGASVVVVDPQPDHLERVASRIRAVAPGLDIIEVPVSFRQHDPYNPTPGSADTEQFGRVVDDIIFQKNQGINIVAVNMSWQINGGCDGNHPLLTHINRLRQNNIIPVGVSHNGGQANYISAPGCLPGVFTVGAVNTSDQVQTYSNSSPALDMLAPAATSGSFQGTSFAAPIVAAAVGALRAPGVRPGASMEEILAILTTTGKPVTDTRQGRVTPRLDMAAAMSQALGETGNTPGCGLPMPAWPAAATWPPTISIDDGTNSSDGTYTITVAAPIVSSYRPNTSMDLGPYPANEYTIYERASGGNWVEIGRSNRIASPAFSVTRTRGHGLYDYKARVERYGTSYRWFYFTYENYHVFHSGADSNSVCIAVN